MSTGGRGVGGGWLGDGDAQDPPRLVEGGGDVPPAQEWAIGLLRRTSSHRPPVGRKQRVRLGLAHMQKRRGRALVLRLALAVLVLVGFGAVASAALGRWPALVAAAYHRFQNRSQRHSFAAPAPRAPQTTGVTPTRASRAGMSGAPAAESAPAPLVVDSVPAASGAGLPQAPPVVVQLAAPESVRRPAPAPGRRSIARAGAARHPAVVPASADDAAPVIAAMRALRVQGDPARARALLTRYLMRYPRGTLAEEALAMSIEAANVQQDGDAAALARRYLRLYPAGHFGALARQTLYAGSPPANH
ncbi:MAG TPA: hypothetical protein VFH68_26380 [Polyangia bacterium]|jgi:hypothetical protein|nr:hypothetical protein [Polyangia bacterium]